MSKLLLKEKDEDFSQLKDPKTTDLYKESVSSCSDNSK